MRGHGSLPFLRTLEVRHLANGSREIRRER